MELKKLYEISEKEHISVINFKMKNKAIIGQINNVCCIGLNYSKISNSREEKELLAEELGHYYYDAFYTASTDISTIEQKEYRANKWKCIALMSIKDFKTAFQQGLRNIFEIADYFNISPKTVEFAYNYYTENDLLKTNAIDSI